MTTRRRLAAASRFTIPAIVLALLAVACTATGATPVPSAAPSAAAATSTSPSPISDGVGGSPHPIGSPTQTDTQTEVGRIWDAVPSFFPRISGAVATETGGGPSSGTFAVGTDLAAAVATMKAGLQALGYNVDVGTPLEDGSIVLDAGGGEDPDCRIEVRFTPLSGTITEAVLYGAACPFG